MSQVPGLLYPALHKFYSALNSLEKFEKGENFFDNISSLDGFFSEYRNITFVLQKSLKGTSYMEVYESLRDKLLINDTGKWFVDKRNEVLKQRPFDLEKKVAITVYTGEYSLLLPERAFTIENDMDYASIIDELQEFFRHVNPVEVMFSAEFSFYERGTTIELYENFIFGIDRMSALLSGLKEVVNEDCPLCNQLESRIKQFNFFRVPKNFLFIDDYIYFCSKGIFEKGSRSEFVMEPAPDRVPITNLFKRFQLGKSPDLFGDFAFMHVVIFQMQRKLMPTLFIVYDDRTISMHSFESSIKTTVYRKFLEVAKRIETDGIANILYVAEMLRYNAEVVEDPNFEKMDSQTRSSQAHSELLSLFKLSKDADHQMMSFESARIDDMEYVKSVLLNPQKLIGYFRFLNSVIGEFERISPTGGKSE